MNRGNMNRSHFEKDPFKAGAALLYDKPCDEVTKRERHNFKEVFFCVLSSDEFISWQAPYVQEALRRQEEELRVSEE